MIFTQTRRQDVIRLYGDAARLLRDARRGESPDVLRGEAVRLVVEFEERFVESEATHNAARSLRRWARDMLSGRFVVASVNLDRAGLALGVRASEARRLLREQEESAEHEVAEEPEVTIEVPKEPEVTIEAPKEPEVTIEAPKEPEVTIEAPKEPEVAIEAPKQQQGDPLLAGLNDAERALVLRLPVGSELLQGAVALAECWGGTMSPTSARGRYSRLGTKLEAQNGRPVLIRGGGRYGRSA